MIVTIDLRKTGSHIQSFNGDLALNEHKASRNIWEKGFYPSKFLLSNSVSCTCNLTVFIIHVVIPFKLA